MKPFIGRAKELKRLAELSQRKSASLVVIKGRRRIGKSRLAEEFAKSKRFMPFTGLAPLEPVSAQDQRNVFARQLAMHMQLPPMTFLDWGDAFQHVSHYLTVQ